MKILVLLQFLCGLAAVFGFPGSRALASEPDFVRSGALRIGPNEVVPLAVLDGPATLARFRLERAGLTSRSLEDLVVSIHWDGSESPGVLSSWTNLFAIDPHGRAFDHVGIQGDQRFSELRFHMPFSRRAEIRLHNASALEIDVRFLLEGWEGCELEPGYFLAATCFPAAPGSPVQIEGPAELLGWFALGTEGDALRLSAEGTEAHLRAGGEPSGQLRGLTWQRRLLHPPVSLESGLKLPTTNHRGSRWTFWWRSQEPELPMAWTERPARAWTVEPPPRDAGGIEAELLHPERGPASVIGDDGFSPRLSLGRGLRLGPGPHGTLYSLLLPLTRRGFYRLQLVSRTQPPAGAVLRVGDGVSRDVTLRDEILDLGTVHALPPFLSMEITLEDERMAAVLDRVLLEPLPRRPHAIEAEDLIDLESPESPRAEILEASIVVVAQQDFEIELPIDRFGRYLVRLHLQEGPRSADLQIEMGTMVLARFEGQAPVQRLAPPLSLPELELSEGDTLRLRSVSSDRSRIALDAISIRDLDRGLWITLKEAAR